MLLLAGKREEKSTGQKKCTNRIHGTFGLAVDLWVSLCVKSRSDTFFYSHFQMVMFRLQFRDQGAPDEVLFYFLQNKAGGI